MAEEVMRMPGWEGRIQRMCSECDGALQRQPDAEAGLEEDEDGLPFSSLGRSPLQIQRFSADVNCDTTKIGSLSFPTYATYSDSSRLGVSMAGSFGASTDFSAAPCACQEVRWIQVIDTNYKANTGWGDVRYVDPQPEDDPAKEPFYWRTAKLTGEAKSEVERKRSGSGATSKLDFSDTAKRQKRYLDTKSPLRWAAELCLTCVDRPKKEVRRLHCVGYGFKMSKDATGKKVELDPTTIQDKAGGTAEHKAAANAYGGGWKVVA